jgi:phage virion morphogenesis protein
MEIRIELDASDIEAFKERLRSQSFKIKMLESLGETMRGQTVKRFVTKTGPDGKGWAPWAASTARRRKGGSLMVDTGRLRNSFSFKVTSPRLTLGSNVNYARYHQFGTKHMPARPMLGIGKRDQAGIENTALAVLRSIL